jgi:stage II sporulation protein D
VRGAIRARWAQLGWENSRLGFPTSDEYAIPGGRRSDFQGGYITWTPATGAVVRLI